VEGTILSSPLVDPLKAYLIGYRGHEEKVHQDEEIKTYAKILDSAPIHMPR